MCRFREAELVEYIEKLQRIINLHALPIMVCRSAGSIVDSGLNSLIKHLQGIEPDTLLMINLKSINSCDLAIVEQSVTFADNVQITASEFVHLMDKGETK